MRHVGWVFLGSGIHGIVHLFALGLGFGPSWSLPQIMIFGGLVGLAVALEGSKTDENQSPRVEKE